MALTTAANVREMLPDANADAERLALLISAYNTAIPRYCQREFEPVSSTTRKFRYDGNGFLDLAPYDLRAVSAVTAYTDLPSASQVTLSAGSATTEADYRLMPLNGTPDGTYLWMILPVLPVANDSTTGYAPGELKGVQVSITATWGCAAVPADVELAAITCVINAYRNPSAFQSMSMGGMSFSEQVDVSGGGNSLNIPGDARALLAPFKRPGLS